MANLVNHPSQKSDNTLDSEFEGVMARTITDYQHRLARRDEMINDLETSLRNALRAIWDFNRFLNEMDNQIAPHVQRYVIQNGLHDVCSHRNHMIQLYRDYGIWPLNKYADIERLNNPEFRRLLNHLIATEGANISF